MVIKVLREASQIVFQDEDAQKFLETLNRWKANDLKRRQIRWLAGLARMFAAIGRDDLDYVEEEDPTLEVVAAGRRPRMCVAAGSRT